MFSGFGWLAQHQPHYPNVTLTRSTDSSTILNGFLNGSLNKQIIYINRYNMMHLLNTQTYKTNPTDEARRISKYIDKHSKLQKVGDDDVGLMMMMMGDDEA